MEQKIEAFSAEDTAKVEKQRNWVCDHYDPESRHLYGTLEGKLKLLDTILKENWIEPTETWKLQSLGITLGDALAQKMGLIWVVVEDEHGRDPALHDWGTTIVMFPLTTISHGILGTLYQSLFRIPICRSLRLRPRLLASELTTRQRLQPADKIRIAERTAGALPGTKT